MQKAEPPVPLMPDENGMTGSGKGAAVLCTTALCILFYGAHATVFAQPEHNESRGELLYSTHCIACHTSDVHWREQKLVTDWNSLKNQVRRWQDYIGLGWSEDEITDVTNYLNEIHYGFPSMDQKGLSHDKESSHALRQ